MRALAWASALLVAVALLVPAAPARAEAPTSSDLADQALESCRGSEHRMKMRVNWAALDDETPPDGTEVLLVRGSISYSITQLLLRDGEVQARSVHASRSSWHNRKGESFGASTFDVTPQQFVVAWNAMRRLLAASDVRIAPEPEDHPLGGSFLGGSGESADWIRARRCACEPPVHCADRGLHAYDWDEVREWDGLRDEAIFEVFESLLPKRNGPHRPAPLAEWMTFAAAEIRNAAPGLDVERVRRDVEFLQTCLRVLGEVGDEACKADVAQFDAAVAALDGSQYPVEELRDEAAQTSTRLRVRLHWDRRYVEQLLRTLPGGTWSSEDQGRWLADQFRRQDPAGWAAFLVEETTRPDARPDDVAVAAQRLRDLPTEQAFPILRTLLAHEVPDVRLEAALALHDLVPEDPAASAAVVTLALDRTIACDWRPSLTDRWCRSRALAAALEWGGLTPADLRAHLLAPGKEQPEFLDQAQRRLASLPEALTDAEAEEIWGPILDTGTGRETLAAVGHLVAVQCSAMKARILAALDRIADSDDVEPRRVAMWRQLAEDLRPPASHEE